MHQTQIGAISANQSQSPRIGAVFPTGAVQAGGDAGAEVSIPSNRGGVSYHVDDALYCECGESLNPLESGRCFLLDLYTISKLLGHSSQSPRIGAVFPTHEFRDPSEVAVYVSIPSNRGGVSYLPRNHRTKLGAAGSQSPRIGAVFPTQAQRISDGVLKVSIPSNRGGVSYIHFRWRTHGKRGPSQSPRIGAVFPTRRKSREH